MLTDEQIENYLFKYVQFQEELTSTVIQIIAERIRDIADLPSAKSLNTLKETMRTSSDISQLKRIVAAIKKKQQEQIDDDFWDMVLFMYAESKRYYEEGQILLQANFEIMKALDELSREARTSLDLLTRNPVIMLRD